MDLNYNPNATTREVFHEGLIDLDCEVKQLLDPKKKGCKVLHKRINPDRAAVRALAYCGTNPTLNR